MGESCANPLAIGVLWLLTAPNSGFGIDRLKPEVQLIVIVFNYAEVPRRTIEQARKFTEEVFAHTGLGIEWTEPGRGHTPHERKETTGRPKFVLRIVPNSMIGTWANDRDLLGFSLVPADGGMGAVAGAYYERIENLSRRLGGKPALVLGYVMAHELGHLLLGAYSHSHSGIMSYPFQGRELFLASQGRLLFTTTQAKRIRKRF